MFLGEADHPVQTFRQKAVVGSQRLAVRACRRGLPERDVVVLDRTDERLIANHANPAVASGVFASDLERAVRAAIVDECVVPVREGLGPHALDALTKVRLAVEHGSDHADKRRPI